MKNEISMVVAVVVFLGGCSSHPPTNSQPDKTMIQRLHKGMLLWEFEQVVGKSAQPRPNPSPHNSISDYDFDGWCIIADIDNSPVAPAATVREYTVIQDGLTVQQRQEKRSKNWSAWVQAHQTRTNGIPNQASHGTALPRRP
jgi:hypothetical protein